MQNINDIQDFIITAMRSIPELVDAISGDPSVICRYDDLASRAESVEDAITGTPTGIILGHTGSSVGSHGIGAVWNHRFQMYIKTPSLTSETSASNKSAYEVLQLLMNGIPTEPDNGETFVNLAIPDTDLGLENIQIQPTYSKDGDQILVVTFSVSDNS